MHGLTVSKHENKRFESQTIWGSGNAYLNCTFVNCTIVVTNVASVFSGCHFNNCNWHLDYLVMWGDEAGASTLISLLEQIRGGGGISWSRN